MDLYVTLESEQVQLLCVMLGLLETFGAVNGEWVIPVENKNESCNSKGNAKVVTTHVSVSDLTIQYEAEAQKCPL